MARVERKGHKNKRVEKKLSKKRPMPRGIVMGAAMLLESELCAYENPEYIRREIHFEESQKGKTMKFEPGITILRSPDPIDADKAERFERMNEAFFRAFNVTKGRAPSGYSGPVDPSKMSDNDKKSFLACLKENGWHEDDEDSNIILGEL